MLSAITAAFAEALQNLRNNFFQTLLSVLGIIIGVAALVAMLSIIDGLESMAREGIAANSSMESVLISARTHRRQDGLNVRMERTAVLTRPLLDSMLSQMTFPAAAQLFVGGTTLIERADSAEKLAVQFMAGSLPFAEEPPTLAYGNALTETDDRSGDVVLVNDRLARRLAATPEGAVGKTLRSFGGEVRVGGVLEAEEEAMGPEVLQIVMPLGLLERLPEPPQLPLRALVNFDRVEDVNEGAEYMQAYFADRFPAIEEPVETVANLDQVAQLEMGFTVFRLVMGFLIGIAVVVGGVGVMNVLLMSINERTPEIGIRKAVGADPRRILTQFLSESVAISTLGSLLGLLMGAASGLLIATVISLTLDVDFHAVFTLRTLFVVFGVAVLTGIIFGTYPARRAARLDPVAAIQRS